MKNNKKPKRIGKLPGELMHVENRFLGDTNIVVESYDEHAHLSFEVESTEQLFQFLGEEENKSKNNWVNINGLKDIGLLHKIGKYFKIHKLSLEDVFNTNHRPKIDIHKDYIFVSAKMIGIDKDDKIEYEQISFFYFKETNNLITIQEYNGDLFDSTRFNLKENIGKVRVSAADYLFYRLMDLIVDNYSYVSETLMLRIEKLEVESENSNEKSVLTEIQLLRRDVLKLKKEVFPTRDILLQLTRRDSDYFSIEIDLYFKDIEDHIIAVIDNINQQKEALVNMLTVYQTNMSSKMNEVIHILTVFSVIFIPLTFVAGVYGMNFKIIPELEWDYGYLYFWLLMIFLTGLILFVFYKKKWM